MYETVKITFVQNYSLTILINNKVDEKGREGVINGVKKDFGNLVKEDLWGVRSLAYEIKHMDKAFYANFEFEAEPEAIIKLDKNIRLNEDIIRYLIVKGKKVKIRTKKKVAEKVEEKAEAARPSDEEKNEKVEAEVKTEKVVEKKAKAKKA